MKTVVYDGVLLNGKAILPDGRILKVVKGITEINVSDEHAELLLKTGNYKPPMNKEFKYSEIKKDMQVTKNSIKKNKEKTTKGKEKGGK